MVEHNQITHPAIDPEIHQVDVVIIGAGLTGLTAAYYAKKRGLSVLVLEKCNRIGGVIQSIHEDGFIIETGPNTGVMGNPEVAELFEDLAGDCTLETANPEAKNRWIWKDGIWNALPNGLLKAIATPLFSLHDKFRILGEPFRKKGTDKNESIAQLVKRRLGNSYLDYAVDPFISGVYAGDPEKLITRFALPKLFQLEQNYGSFIKGGFKKSSEKKSERDKKATREVFSAEDGLEALIKALAKQIGHENIILNAIETNIKRVDGIYFLRPRFNDAIQQIKAKNVITTVDASALRNLFPFIENSDIFAISNLRYAKVMQVLMGFKKWNGIPINAFGGLVPSKEKKDILGILFTSSFLKNRAPEGGALLSVFVGGIKRPELFELSDVDLKELVFREVKDMMQLQEVDPDIFHIFRYPRAIPQYELSSEERYLAIEKIQTQFKGLYLAGGIRDGIGMADRIKQARTIAYQLPIN